MPMGTLTVQYHCSIPHSFLCLFFVLHYSPASTILEHSLVARLALQCLYGPYLLPPSSYQLPPRIYDLSAPRDGTWLNCPYSSSQPGRDVVVTHNLTLLRPHSVFRSSHLLLFLRRLFGSSILSASLSLYTSDRSVLVARAPCL